MFGFDAWMIAWLVVWGLIGAGIARGKGRSKVGWFIGCGLLPLLVIVLLFLKQAGEVRGQVRQCPSCKEFIKWNATVCRYCNQKMVPPNTLSGIKNCPHCGTHNRQEDNSCIGCSQKI